MEGGRAREKERKKKSKDTGIKLPWILLVPQIIPLSLSFASKYLETAKGES